MSDHYRDQVRYSAATVEEYLPSCWDQEWVLQPRLRREAATGLKSKVDPRHIPDHLLAAGDIQVGYRKARLSKEERECLRNTAHLGFTPGELATAWGVRSEDVHHAVMSGIAKIVRYLNGEVPA